MLTPTDLQRQTLHLYGELISRREAPRDAPASYAGQLIFCCGEGSSATGLPAAVSIAGGTALALDPDAAAVKAVFRQGSVDFVVNTLDEALRVLKNQIRQRRPLSVTLIADLQLTLAEMIERGVLPDLHIAIDSPEAPPAAPSTAAASESDCEPRLAQLEHTGMQRLRLSSRNGLLLETDRLAAWLAERGWLETAIEAASTAAQRALDAHLLSLLPTSDTPRRTWLERISHYQRPSPGAARVLWLTAVERAAIAP